MSIAWESEHDAALAKARERRRLALLHFQSPY